MKYKLQVIKKLNLSQETYQTKNYNMTVNIVIQNKIDTNQFPKLKYQ